MTNVEVHEREVFRTIGKDGIVAWHVIIPSLLNVSRESFLRTQSLCCGLASGAHVVYPACKVLCEVNGSKHIEKHGRSGKWYGQGMKRDRDSGWDCE